MLNFLIRRLIIAILVAITVSIVGFGLLRFSGDLFRSVVRENADAAVEMCRILAERLANTTLKLQQMSNPGPK